ncbi:uncharacterized protein METZ01_LOCUS348765, partial [marine metagenome]
NGSRSSCCELACSPVVKSVLVGAAFMAAFLLPVQARMTPNQFEIKAVCWDNAEEAIRYHEEILGEYPIGKGWVSEHSFGAIMHNPVKPSWTFLSFHKNDNGVIVCAITGGTHWETINLGDESEKLEL